ncbi:tetratricopeptide repeat protein [Trichothermofontia sp.]
MSLSLCMIVKDEAANLPRCLESVQGVVDEMVILDTGSSDATIAIATAYGAKVDRIEWPNDFAAARNQSLARATGDWILVLDADESLVPEVIPTLQAAMSAENHLLVNLVRQEVGALQSPYSLVSRLFRRRSDLQFQRAYHELIDDSVAALLQREPHWQVITLAPVAIRHWGYEPGTIAARQKRARAQAMLEQALAQQPADAYLCSKLGALYLDNGQVAKGLVLLHRGLNANPTEAEVLYDLHYHLGIAYSRINQPQAAIGHYQQATQQPILALLKLAAYNNWGSLLKEQGDLAGAEAAYQTVLQLDPHFALGYYNLGLTLRAQGRLQGAVAAYQQALRLNPDHAEAYQNMGVVLLKLGSVPASMNAFRRAIALHRQQGNPEEADRLRQGLGEMGWQL